MFTYWCARYNVDETEMFITVPFQVCSITDELQSFQSGIYWLMWMPIVILMVPDVDIIFAMFVNDATPYSVNGSKCYRVQAKAEIIWLLILPNCIAIYSMFELFLTLFPFFFSSTPRSKNPGPASTLHIRTGLLHFLQGLGLEPTCSHWMVPWHFTNHWSETSQST